MLEQVQLTFASKQEALDFLRGKAREGYLEESSKRPGVFWDAETYYTSHGEYERPDYMVRRYGDGWGIRVEYYYYAGTYGAPADGRLDYDPWVDWSLM